MRSGYTRPRSICPARKRLGQMNASTCRYERARVWTDRSAAIVALARNDPFRQRLTGAFQNFPPTQAVHGSP